MKIDSTSGEDLLPPLPDPPTSLAGEWSHDGHVVSFANARAYAQAYALEAVLAERERCARLCEELSAFDMYDPGQTYADAIRKEPT